MGNIGEPSSNNYAWQNHLPCLNPSCKSHGRPHPNCRCYGMAEGGEVEHYCSSDRTHKEYCEYFAGGGEVDFDSLQEDTPAAVGASGNVSAHPTQQNFDDLQDDSEKYNSIGQTIGAGVEGAARGVIGPLATAAELGASKLGVPNMTAEDIAGRESAHPVLSGAAEIGSLAASTLGSFGLGAGLKAAAESLPIAAETAPLAYKAGAAFLKNSSWGFLKQGSDEISKAMLGQGDQNAPAASALANMVAAGLTSGVTGTAIQGAGSILGKSATNAATKFGIDPNTDLGINAQKFLGGIEHGNKEIQGISQEVLDAHPMFKMGSDLAKDTYNKLNSMGGNWQSAAKTGFIYGPEAFLRAVGVMIGAKPLAKVGSKYIVPSMLNVLSNSEGEYIPQFGNVLSHIKDVTDGADKIANVVNGVFQPTLQKATDGKPIEKLKDLIKENIANDGLNQNIQQQQYENNKHQSQVPHMAEGGEVNVEHDSVHELESKRKELHTKFHSLMDSGKHEEADKIDDEIEHVRTKLKSLGNLKKVSSNIKEMPQTPMQKGEVSPLFQKHDPVAKFFPEQNVIMQAAKMRVSNYLSQQQPNKNPQMLPFDRKPDQSKQEKSYDKAVTLAVDPLSIFNKIKDGRLTHDDMTHFTSMYPELHDHLKKKLTERIVQAQINGEKPSPKIRQSMSLFMGAALDTTMTQPMMAAAQATFMPKQPQQSPGQSGKNKKGTSSLSKVAEEYQTSTDAAAKRGQETK